MSNVRETIDLSSPRQYLCSFLGALEREHRIKCDIVWKGVGHLRPCLLLRNEEVIIRLLLQRRERTQ